MATTYKVLAQSAPSATTETTLYTVPSSTSAVVSTIAITNQAGTSGTYRIAVRPGQMLKQHKSTTLFMEQQWEHQTQSC